MPRIFDTHTARVLATAGLALALVAFIYLARRTLTVFLFAILFAYLLEPVIPRLQQWLRLNRGWAIALVYAVFAVGFLMAAFGVGPRLAVQAAHMMDRLPSLAQRVTSGQIARQFGREHGWSSATQRRLQHLLASHPAAFLAFEADLTEYVTAAARNLFWILLIPVLALFFLKEGHRMKEAVVEAAQHLLRRSQIEQVLTDLHLVMAHYIGAQLMLSLLAAAVFMLGFWTLRLPYAALLGSVAGVLEFIPMVGPLAAFLLVVAVSLLAGYRLWILLLLFFAVFRLVQDYVVSPRLMGSQVKLPPLAVLFGVFAGGEMAGVLGVYLSIPVLASLRVLWNHWRRWRE